MKEYRHHCNNCHSHNPCGCNEPNFIGCKDKPEFTCVVYTSENLLPTNIKKGDNGDTVLQKINDEFQKIEDQIESIELGETLIESIGGKIPIYNGISPQMIHQIRSIKGEEGVIIETITEPSTGCGEDNTYINVRIDQVWLTNYLNQWIKTVNLCPLVQGCCETPPVETDPVTTDIVKSILNREFINITSTDFLNNYTDADGHPLTSVIITGAVTGFTLNGTQITSGQEITLFAIQSGVLRYTADNIDTAYTKTVSYVAKDSSGATSNISSIIINVAAKVFLSFSTPTVALIREVSNTKTSTIDYTSGTGQNMPNGHVFVSQGTAGQPGYLRITSTSQVTLNGIGTIPIQVVSIPTAVQQNQTVMYTFDGSNGGVSLTYNSNPTTTDIIVDLPNRGSHTFSSNEFISHFNDYDGDTLVEFRAMSPVTGMKLNGVNYIAGIWIPVNNATLLTFEGANQNAAYQQLTPWQGKDSQGNVSNL